VDSAALNEIPLFADLTDGERAAVASSLCDITVEPGAALAVQGENAYHWFVIESGSAEVRRDGAVVRTLGPGDVFGEIGLLATGTRTASVVATSSMQLAAMFMREFKQLDARTPGLGRALRDAMADRPWIS